MDVKYISFSFGVSSSSVKEKRSHVEKKRPQLTIGVEKRPLRTRLPSTGNLAAFFFSTEEPNKTGSLTQSALLAASGRYTY